MGGGVQTNPNLPTIVQQKGDFNPHPARTLLQPPSNTERSASSGSLRLSFFYIHINLHLILNSPTFTQIFCSPIQFTSLGLIQKHTSFTPYTDTATPPSALSIGAVLTMTPVLLMIILSLSSFWNDLLGQDWQVQLKYLLLLKVQTKLVVSVVAVVVQVVSLYLGVIRVCIQWGLNLVFLIY